jgi:hypothetical protein
MKNWLMVAAMIQGFLLLVVMWAAGLVAIRFACSGEYLTSGVWLCSAWLAGIVHALEERAETLKYGITLMEENKVNRRTK